MHWFCCRVTDWLYLSPENILNYFLTSWPRTNLWHVALWRFFSLSMLVPHVGVSHVAEHWPVVSLDQKQVTILSLFSSCRDSHTLLILLIVVDQFWIDSWCFSCIYSSLHNISTYCLPKKHLLWCNNTHKFCLRINQIVTAVSAQFIDSQLTETHSSQ